MKHLNKVVSLLLALVMVLSLGVSAFATTTTDQTNSLTPSVTISEAQKGSSFTLYKIFDLESYTGDSFTYTISTSSPLFDTIRGMTLPHTKSDGTIEDKPVFTLTTKPGEPTVSYVQLAPEFKDATNNGETVNSIASKLVAAINVLTPEQKNALSMRQIQNVGVSGETDTSKNETKLPEVNKADITTTVTREATKTEPAEYSVKFDKLGLGYYLIDSSASAMIGLTTTAPVATIQTKSNLPLVVKEVKKNADGSWSNGNAKKIGETVNFRVQVSVEPGEKNYVIYDNMSEGLTFDKITKVYYGYATGVDTRDDRYTIYDASKNEPIDSTYIDFTEATADKPIDYNGKKCCFKMKFTDKFLNQVLDDFKTQLDPYSTVIYVEYDAILNDKAVVGEYKPADGQNGNPNDVYLTYSTGIEVGHDKTVTCTFMLELVKTKSDGTLLSGAKFEVYDTRQDAVDGTEGKQIQFIKGTDQKTSKTTYRVATADEITAGGPTLTTTIEAGDVLILGLGGNYASGASDDGRAYYFKETQAPQGYALLTDPQEVKIQRSDILATFETGRKDTNNNPLPDMWTGGGLRVINNSGSTLPETGGMGTTLFYVVGSVLLVGATVLLVTKKRMSADK